MSKFNRELVSLCCGQAGIQIGDAIWQTLTAEHNVDPFGKLTEGLSMTSSEEHGMKTFFHNGPENQFVPRNLIMDSEPTVIDEIRSGYFRKLFHPELMINGVEDASNNYARGYYCVGRSMLATLMEKCRYIAESCECLQGFMNVSGCGGGTGSGLFTKLLEQLTVEYSGKTFVGTIIAPGQLMSNCVVDPYNTVLRLSKTVETDDINFLLNNESLYGICQKLNIERPTYHNINKVITPVVTTFTAPLRFAGPLTGNLTEISTNLIPYPRINFAQMNYSPLNRDNCIDRALLDTKEMTLDLFDSSNNMLNCNLSKGLFMSAVVIYRGNHSVNNIVESIRTLKSLKKYKWVDWCPTGFKIVNTTFPAIHSFSMTQSHPQKSILMISNHSSITTYIDQEIKKFACLFRKRSYIFWFTSEGMEEDEFKEALEDLASIRWDYEQICENGEEEAFNYEEEGEDEVVEEKKNIIKQSKSKSKMSSSKTNDDAITDLEGQPSSNINELFYSMGEEEEDYKYEYNYGKDNEEEDVDENEEDDDEEAEDNFERYTSAQRSNIMSKSRSS